VTSASSACRAAWPSAGAFPLRRQSQELSSRRQLAAGLPCIDAAARLQDGNLHLTFPNPNAPHSSADVRFPLNSSRRP
jgi:hypothetical protein